MNEGVKILLERIKTNPEEFTEGKWHSLIQSHRMFLNKEDCEALDEAINKLMQQRFTERVMKELLAPEEEDDSLGKPWYSKQGNITLSAGQTLGHASLTLTTDPLVQAHIDAHNTVLKKQKKHQTLFGRLFNYT
jgi:hypothetical protein